MRFKSALLNGSNICCIKEVWNYEEVSTCDFYIFSYQTEVVHIYLYTNRDKGINSITVDIDCPQDLRTKTSTKHIRKALEAIGLDLWHFKKNPFDEMVWKCWRSKDGNKQHDYQRITHN